MSGMDGTGIGVFMCALPVLCCRICPDCCFSTYVLVELFRGCAVSSYLCEIFNACVLDIRVGMM